MIHVKPAQVSPQLRALFHPDEPAGLRLTGVLEGIGAGTIVTDDPANPAWGAVIDPWGTIYWGGRMDTSLLSRLVHQQRQQGEALIGLWPDDPRIAFLPPGPEYEGWVQDCTNRPIGEGLDAYLQVPAGCQIRTMDRELFARSADYELNLALSGGVNEALAQIVGFFLVRGDEILSEASAGPLIHGIREMGTATPEAHRRQGYATLVCAHVIRACERAGCATYWNCNKANLPSVALARKLGYRTVREYRLWAWFKQH